MARGGEAKVILAWALSGRNMLGVLVLIAAGAIKSGGHLLDLLRAVSRINSPSHYLRKGSKQH
jgi:DMSO reductase anchor subunit